MKATLLIVLESAGKALPIARVEDNSLLLMAARNVISKADADSRVIGQLDGRLGGKAQVESRRLSEQLAALVPGLFVGSVSVVN